MSEMTTINERMKLARASLKLSQREFSKRISISQSMIADMEMGHIPVKERYLKLISSEFNVNIDWLTNGTGEMFSEPPPDLRLDRLIEIFKQFDPDLQNAVLEHCRQLLKIHKKK